MKKIYIKPDTDIVNVNLINSVLDKGGFGKYSNVAGGGDDDGDPDHNFGDAKENNFLWEDDLWDNGDSNSNPYDMWGEN